MGAPYNFETKARIPVRPLSYDSKDKAVAKELIIDYENGVAYVCDIDGNIIDIGANPNTINAICQYLKEHPELITKNITITVDGEAVSLESILLEHSEDIKEINNDISEINDSITEINSTITKNKKECEKALAKALENVSKQLENYLKLTGGELTGKLGMPNNTPIYGKKGTSTIPMIFVNSDGNVVIADGSAVLLNGPIILSSDNYGNDIPSSGKEGQLFFKLI